MKTIPFNKNLVLSIILAIVVVTILNRITPPHVDPVFTVVVSKNRASILGIHQARDIEMSKEFKIDRINLAEKSRFRHAKLGDLGYENDFFADVDAPFTVKIAGDYIFYIGSDDGFAFDIDGKQVCEWAHTSNQTDRPFATDTCQVRLSAGDHRFKLSYYQGYGNAGLIMSYANTLDSKQFLAGDDSKYIKF